MTTRRHMTLAQRQHHYQQWRESGMNKNQYARHHGINIKTFGNLCRTLAAGSLSTVEAAPLAILPVVVAPDATSEASISTVTLTLKRASITGTPHALAVLVRELSLC